MRPILFNILLLAFVAGSVGCKSKQKPEYARPLPPGAPALRKVSIDQWPDLRYALPMNDGFMASVRRSLRWFDYPSTKAFFPMEGITHDQAHASVFAMPTMASQSKAVPDFIDWMKREFDVYESVGWNGEGVVLFTGYYTPIYSASDVRTPEYRFPLYKRPADLVTDDKTGEVKGRRVVDGPAGRDGLDETPERLVPYPPRREIEGTNMLAGSELVWLQSRLDAYIIEVQGSAKLNMTDGSSMLIGYAGTNGHDYTSLRHMLVEDEKVDKNIANLPIIRRYFDEHPEDLDHYIKRNDRFIFFKTYDSTDWPAGSLGFKVEPEVSLATDKRIFPRGGITMIDTRKGTKKAGAPRWQKLTLDQDTGGAIRAPGRADIYYGIGPGAEMLAGQQIAEGKLYYFFLKPDRVQEWAQLMQQAKGVQLEPQP